MSFFGTVKRFAAISLAFMSIGTVSVSAATVGQVTGVGVNVRKAASTDASVITKLNSGATLNILGVSGDWYKIQSFAGEAYITSQFVKITQADGTINSSNVNVRTAASNTASVAGQVGTGTVLNVKGVSGDWYAVDYNGTTAYVYKDFVTGEMLSSVPSLQADAAQSSKSAQIVEYAKKFVGTPYAYGGTDLKSGVDCSGFTYALYRDFGVTLNRCSKDQISNGSKVDKASLQQGDLVFFSENGANISHVGMYIGGGQYIHSTDGKAYGVTISDLNSSYSLRTYYGACRVL